VAGWRRHLAAILRLLQRHSALRIRDPQSQEWLHMFRCQHVLGVGPDEATSARHYRTMAERAVMKKLPSCSHPGKTYNCGSREVRHSIHMTGNFQRAKAFPYSPEKASDLHSHASRNSDVTCLNSSKPRKIRKLSSTELPFPSRIGPEKACRKFLVVINRFC
jgi:hypothetical protein